MKICIAVDMHKTFIGGALQARLLAHALRESGHQVLLVCMDRMETAPCVKEPKTLLARHQLEFETVPCREKPLLDFFTDHQEKYDLVHFFGGFIPISLLDLIKKQAKPIILRPFGLKLDDPGTISQTDRGRRYLEKLFQLVDSFVGISEPLYQSILSSPFYADGPLKAVKLVNAVDTDFFAPLENRRQKESLKRELGVPVDSPLAVFVGRFEYRKGADILINSWPVVRKAHPRALLAIIGSVCTICQQTDSCHISQGESLPLSQSSRLVTHKFSGLFQAQAGIKFLENQEKVEKYFQAADLFFFPTRQEGMPNALLEAMASGLASVTSGIKEITMDVITGPQLGLTVESEDPQEYAQAVVRLLTDHKERSAIGGNARRKMVEEFSLNKNLDRHLGLYNRLINRNQPG